MAVPNETASESPSPPLPPSSPQPSRNPVRRVRGLLTRNRSMSEKIFGAVADQGFFAGTNFLVNVLLGAWLDPESYGTYVIAYSWFLLLLGFYDALLIEPLGVYGSGKYSKKFREYLGLMFYGHTGLTLIIALIFVIGALAVSVFGTPTHTFAGLDAELKPLLYMTTYRGATNGLMVAALYGTALAAPFILLRWLTRQPFYVMGKPYWSAAGGAIYMVVALITLVILQATGTLSAVTALLLMGFASFVASGALTVTLLKPKLRFEKDELIQSRQVIKDHFDYGKWSTSNRLLQWLASNFGYLIVPVIAGLSGTAALRALNNLIMPLFQINTSLIALLVPMFVRAYENQGKEALDRRVKRLLVVGFGLTSVYGLLVVLFGGPVMHLIYNGKYDHVATLPFLIATAGLPIIFTCSQIINAALNSMRKVKYTFLARLLPTALTVILDALFLSLFGLIGVPLESLITASIVFFSVWRYYNIQIKSGDGGETGNKPTPAPEPVS